MYLSAEVRDHTALHHSASIDMRVNFWGGVQINCFSLQNIYHMYLALRQGFPASPF